MNLWLAFINLEFNFGDEEKLIAVFKRALNANKPLVIYQRMIELYQSKENWKMVQELAQVMVKKFKFEKSAWKFYLKCEMDRIQALNLKDKKIKEILKRTLTCLPKSQHFEILSYYAQLEYKVGDPEKGRNTFEEILTTYPKRTDLWSIYLDMESKFSQPEQVRILFERCL